MKVRRSVSALVLVALLASCGGGGGGGSGGGSLGVAPGGGATPTPTTPAPTACTVRDRQNWALARMQEWYLFPETLPASLEPAAYATLEDYLDALTATARSQRKDRFFTYITSIAEENAFYTSGSSAGFGVRLSYDQPGRVFVAEAFEGAPALAAGIDRGTEILAIGTSAANLRTVSAIIAAEGVAGVTTVLGPTDPGVSRFLRVRDSAGTTRELSVAKADYELTPVSSRYGARVIQDGARRVGYINLRTFISPAETPLKAAFDGFRAQGITEVIVDLRYNGGGLVRVAELIGDLMGGNRTTSDVFSYTSFRPSKAAENDQRNFQPQPQSIAPTKVAFIGTGASASASELVINAFIPYLGANAALVGANTFGKPVGQIALDRAACDDRLRVVAFATQNRDRQGDYYDGLATTVQATCQASDDVAFPLGDAREASVARALDFLAGRPCTPISATSGEATGRSVSTRRTLLQPERPSTAQREVPGLF